MSSQHLPIRAPLRVIISVVPRHISVGLRFRMLKGLKILCLVVAVAALCGAGDDAAWLFAAGEKAGRAGDRLQAYLLYSQAARLEPGNALYARKQAESRGAAALSRAPVL